MAHAGIVRMEYMGYPLFSGSNTMASAVALHREGRLPFSPRDTGTAVIASPGGINEIDLRPDGATGTRATYRAGSTSFVQTRGLSVDPAAHGQVTYDVVWGGCFYAVANGPRHGIALTPTTERRMGDVAEALMREAPAPLPHPEFGDQGPLRFVLWVSDVEEAKDGLRQTISPVVFPASVSRCPSGTGTSAAMACLANSGRLAPGRTLTTVSAWGGAFEGRFEPAGSDGGIRCAVAGTARLVSRTEWIVGEDDPFAPRDGSWDLLLEASGRDGSA